MGADYLATFKKLDWGFFVGPDKAGSTWAHAALVDHPNVATPAAKDLFYFDRYPHRGLGWYLEHFEVSPRTCLCVEVCHDYMFDPAAMQRIALTFPHARIVVVARDPVARAVSAHLYMRRQGRTRLPLSRALREVDQLVGHGRYHQHISSILDHFPREQVTVLDFDRLEADPSRFARELYHALGAPLREPGGHLMVPWRGAAVPRSYPVAKVGKRLAGTLRKVQAERLLARLKSSRLMERTLFRELASDERPSASREDRAYLRSQLSDDTQALDVMLGTSFHDRWWGRPCHAS